MRTKLVSKEDLIKIGETIIKEEGIDKCSVRRIAKEMHMAVGTFYNYYESREDYLIALFHHSWSRTFTRLREDIDMNQTSEMDQIKEMFDILYEEVENRNGLGRKLYLDSLVFKETPVLDIQESIRLVLEEIIHDDVIKNHKKTIIKWLVLSMTDSLYKGHYLSREEFDLFEGLISKG